MVREVSEDKMYDTVEFNEFLTMIGKQGKNPITKESLVDAFKYLSPCSCYRLLIITFCQDI